jgi:hypothetical protein
MGGEVRPPLNDPASDRAAFLENTTGWTGLEDSLRFHKSQDSFTESIRKLAIAIRLFQHV